VRSSLEQHSYLHPQNGRNIQNIDYFFIFLSKSVNIHPKRAIPFLDFIATEQFLYRLKKKLYRFLAINRQKKNPS
jgi:hypothetical protein